MRHVAVKSIANGDFDIDRSLDFINMSPCKHIRLSPAQGLVIYTLCIVRCMLTEGQVPKPIANLVSTLATLDGDKLTRHQV